MQKKILICAGTSGLSAGADKIAREFETQLKKNKISGYQVVKTGDRGLFRDVLVDVIESDEKRVVYEFVKLENVEEIVNQHLLKGEPVQRLLAKKDYHQFFENQTRIVLAHCGEIDPENIEDYMEHKGYEALKKALTFTPEDIIEQVKKSGLRGRGGGGFSTGLKWEFARKAEGEEKYLICNADEGDPGAFMDRSILEGDPHAALEGMLIAAYAIGCGEGYIYCRAEYPVAIKRLNLAIAQAKKKGFLGKNILGSKFSFELSIIQGAGAFVCGEETALIASIEGQRGIPRPRPPYPAQKGLWGQPTNINNVETFANVPPLVLNGPDWYASIGTEKSKGTKVFALAGKLKNTGLVEVPMGTTIRELIYGPGGGMAHPRSQFKAVQIGGPSGGCLPADLLDMPIDYETIAQTGAIMGSGGIVIMDEKTCMVDVARYFLSFTVEESCGKCVPCRVGLKRMEEVLELITHGQGKDEHLAFLSEMAGTIKNTAHCGLGNTAPNPVLTTLKYFPGEYQAHVKDSKCPAVSCVELIDFEVIKEKCVKCGLCFKACPVGAITWQKGETAVIDKDKCIQCKACIGACYFGAIK